MGKHEDFLSAVRADQCLEIVCYINQGVHPDMELSWLVWIVHVCLYIYLFLVLDIFMGSASVGALVVIYKYLA